MSVSRVIRAITIVLIAGLPFAALPANAPALAQELAQDAAEKRYVHPQLGWSINLPEEWVRDEESLNYVDFGTRKGNPWARVSVRVFAVTPKAGPLEKFVRGLRGGMEQDGTRATVVSTGKRRLVGGIPALEFIDEREHRGNRFITLELWTLVGDRRFLVNAFTDKASWDALGSTLQAIVHSFSPIPAPAVPTAPRIFTYASKFGSAGDSPPSIQRVLPLAEQGSAKAQYLLGQMYTEGRGAPKDDAEAVKWLQKAAEQGLAQAQNDLGVKYEWGIGVSRDYAIALKWYRSAADQGIAFAQHNLGKMAYDGKGVSRDFIEAEKWYRQAADQGLDKAQVNLGHLYEQGLGVEQDYAEAKKWFLKAAAGGNLNAQYNLGDLYYSGKGADPDRQTAANWFLKASEWGHAMAQFRLAHLFFIGHGVSQSLVQSHMWASLAIPQLPRGRFRQLSIKLRDEVEADMNEDEIAEAEELAREWKPKSE